MPTHDRNTVLDHLISPQYPASIFELLLIYPWKECVENRQVPTYPRQAIETGVKGVMFGVIKVANKAMESPIAGHIPASNLAGQYIYCP